LESRAIESFQNASAQKQNYIECGTCESSAAYKSAYQSELAKGIILGAAGIGVLSGTGVFLATKVISVDPGAGGLAFSATW